MKAKFLNWWRSLPGVKIDPKTWRAIILCLMTAIVCFSAAFVIAARRPQAPLVQPTVGIPSTLAHSLPGESSSDTTLGRTSNSGSLDSRESSDQSSAKPGTVQPTSTTGARRPTTTKSPPGQGGPIPSQPHPTKTIQSTTTTQEETSSSSMVTPVTRPSTTKMTGEKGKEKNAKAD